MKNVVLVFLILALAGFHPLIGQSCCQLSPQSSLPLKEATLAFADLGEDSEFVSVHANPLPYQLPKPLGKMINFPVRGDDDAYAYAIKSKTSKKNFVIIFHEWWGLNDHIKREADRLYDDLGSKINVIAVDLYDERVAEDRAEASELMQGLDQKRAGRIIEGILNYAGNDARIVTLGWCMGGGFSLQAALVGRKKIAGCVIYYGMPEKDVDKLRNLNSDVLGIFASQEQWISPQVVDEFKKNMQKAGKKLIVHSFDAEHAFANPSNPNFDNDAAKEAYQISYQYIQNKF